MLEVAEFIARKVSGLFSLEMWGGATYDTCRDFSVNAHTRDFAVYEKKYRIFFFSMRRFQCVGMQIILTMLSRIRN